MSEFLKGNFQVKNPVKESKKKKDKKTQISDKFRKAALNSIGGSMVYVERTDLSWDGEEEGKEEEEEASKNDQ